MGARKRRYVGKPILGDGWRIWDTKIKRWWGNVFADYPTAMLDELNGEKSPPRLTELGKPSRKPKSAHKSTRKRN